MYSREKQIMLHKEVDILVPKSGPENLAWLGIDMAVDTIRNSDIEKNWDRARDKICLYSIIELKELTT